MLNKPDSAGPPLSREQLSSLMDGEAVPGLAAEHMPQTVAQWANDADMAQSWHVYHLVGDTLRSDELAASPRRDQAFLLALRQRLADEPVPLAPAPLVPAVPPPVESLWTRRRGLIAPMAMAAGFVAVAGLLLILRSNQVAPPEGAQMAVAPREGVVPASGSNVIRDTRLDRYLQAHRTQGNGFGAMAAGGTQFQIVYEPE